MEPSTLLWMGALLLVWYLSVGFGVTVAYHRVLTHRSATLRKPVLYALVLAGLPAGPPAEWVGNHRRHHADSDGPNDPHSPVHDGFWYAHCGWYLGIRNRGVCLLYALGGPLRYVVGHVPSADESWWARRTREGRPRGPLPPLLVDPRWLHRRINDPGPPLRVRIPPDGVGGCGHRMGGRNRVLQRRGTRSIRLATFGASRNSMAQEPHETIDSWRLFRLEKAGTQATTPSLGLPAMGCSKGRWMLPSCCCASSPLLAWPTICTFPLLKPCCNGVAGDGARLH